MNITILNHDRMFKKRNPGSL